MASDLGLDCLLLIKDSLAISIASNMDLLKFRTSMVRS